MNAFEQKAKQRQAERIRIAKQGGDVQAYLRNERNANLTAVAKAETKGKDYQTAHKAVETPELDAAVGNTPDFVAPSSSSSSTRQLTNEEQALEIMGLLNPVDFSPEAVAERTWKEYGVDNAQDFQRVSEEQLKKFAEDTKYTLETRIPLAAESSLLGWAGSHLGTARTLWDAGEALLGKEDSKVGNWLNYKTNELMSEAEADRAQAVAGLGKTGEFLADAGILGGHQLWDWMATGGRGGKASMVSRSFGAAAQEAQNKGYGIEQQIALGLTSAATEWMTEKAFGGNPFYDQGQVGLVNQAIAEMTNNKALLKFLSSAPVETLNEGLEEILSGVLTPVWELIITGEADWPTVKELVRDGALGVVSSAGGQVANHVTGGLMTEKPTAEESSETESPLIVQPQEQKAATGESVTAEELAGILMGENATHREEIQADDLSDVMKGEKLFPDEVHPVSVGRTTTIKNPYKGTVPTQTFTRQAPTEIGADQLQRAHSTYQQAEAQSQSEGTNFKTVLSRLYKAFKGPKAVPVSGMSFNDQQYFVDVPNNLPGKLISQHPSAESFSILDSLDSIIRNGEYVGSGSATVRGKPKKAIARYDYFESDVTINGAPYIVKWDVEVVPGGNNYKTHRVVNMQIDPVGEVTRAGSVDQKPSTTESIGDQTAEMPSGSATNVSHNDPVVNRGPYHPINEKAQRVTQQNRGRDPVRIPIKNRQGKLTSKTLSTLANANMTSDEVVSALLKDFSEGKFSRWAYTDEAAVQNAKQTIEKIGWDAALEQYKSDAKSGKASKDITTMGIVLYNNAVNYGDVVTAMEIAALTIKNSRSTAQAQQALNMINKLSPEGRFYATVKSVEQIQQDLIDKFGNDAPNIEIDPALLSEYRDALVAGDQETATAVYEDIKWNIAEQLPTTFAEKLNAWRYLAMLGNPRTQIRNIAGNLGFVPLRMVKNGFATLGESFLPEGVERTKAVIDLTHADDRALVQTAWMDYANVEDAIMSGGKLGSENLRSDAEQNKQIFNSVLLEGARVTVDEMMKAGDTLFSKPTYCEALAMYLKANGWTAADFTNGNMTDAEIGRAREVAMKEAMRATYRDTNAITEAVNAATSGIKRLAQKDGASGAIGKGLNVLVEGVLPFKKTPANVLARAIDYSPAGIIKGVVQMKKSVSDGSVTAAEAIDSLAAGLTGTGAMALGVFLRSIGMLSGGEDEDDKQAGFDDLQGKQPWAVTVGSKNFTIDWAGPAVVSMLVGAELFDASQDKGLTFRETVDSIMGLADPIVEMSFLSGLQDLMETGKYGDAGIVAYLATAATSYLSQYVPTLFGQIERNREEGRQETYRYNDEHSDVLGPSGQRFVGTLMNKLPGEYNQIDYVDAWGRTQDYGNPLFNALNQFANPAYVSDARVTEVDGELQRLFDAGQSTVFPQRRSQSDTIAVRDAEGNIVEERHLTAEEYEQYNRTKGQTSLELVSQLMDTDLYKGMNDDEKANAIENIYSYAKAMADLEAEPTTKLDSWVKKAKESSDPGKYIQLYSATQNLEPDGDKKTVSTWQKVELVVENTNTKQADEFIPLYLEGNYPTKYEMARERGYSPERFVEAYTAMNTIESDRDENGESLGNVRKKVIAHLVSQGWPEKNAAEMYKLFRADTKDIESWKW